MTQKKLSSPESIAESFLAQAKLAKLELAQGVYDQWRSADSDLLQREFAVLYTNILGVPPEAHDELRHVLERVRDQSREREPESGHETVEQIIDGIRLRFQLNGGLVSPAGD